MGQQVSKVEEDPKDRQVKWVIGVKEDNQDSQVHLVPKERGENEVLLGHQVPLGYQEWTELLGLKVIQICLGHNINYIITYVFSIFFNN